MVVMTIGEVTWALVTCGVIPGLIVLSIDGLLRMLIALMLNTACR